MISIGKEIKASFKTWLPSLNKLHVTKAQNVKFENIKNMGIIKTHILIFDLDYKQWIILIHQWFKTQGNIWATITMHEEGALSGFKSTIEGDVCNLVSRTWLCHVNTHLAHSTYCTPSHGMWLVSKECLYVCWIIDLLGTLDKLSRLWPTFLKNQLLH